MTAGIPKVTEVRCLKFRISTLSKNDRYYVISLESKTCDTWKQNDQGGVGKGGRVEKWRCFEPSEHLLKWSACPRFLPPQPSIWEQVNDIRATPFSPFLLLFPSSSSCLHPSWDENNILICVCVRERERDDGSLFSLFRRHFRRRKATAWITASCVVKRNCLVLHRSNS